MGISLTSGCCSHLSNSSALYGMRYLPPASEAAQCPAELEINAILSTPEYFADHHASCSVWPAAVASTQDCKRGVTGDDMEGL